MPPHDAPDGRAHRDPHRPRCWGKVCVSLQRLVKTFSYVVETMTCSAVLSSFMSTSGSRHLFLFLIFLLLKDWAWGRFCTVRLLFNCVYDFFFFFYVCYCQFRTIWSITESINSYCYFLLWTTDSTSPPCSLNLNELSECGCFSPVCLKALVCWFCFWCYHDVSVTMTGLVWCRSLYYIVILQHYTKKKKKAKHIN